MFGRSWPCLLLLLTACTGADDAPSVDERDPGLALAVGEVAEVEPGGDTLCARGAAFRFFARGGDPSKVIIDFQGGGACWDEATCKAGEAIYFQEPTTTEEFADSLRGDFFGGFYELDNSDNPFAGWTMLHIPYCSGDIHWGDASVAYSDEVSIEHRGFINARAALDWLAERYSPETIFVSGFSAGAYGAIGHSPYIAEQYPKADITVLGDSGNGVITDDFFDKSFPNWNVDAVVPRHVAGLEDAKATEMTIIDLYVSIANHYADRNMRFAQYSTAFDKDQTIYYEYMGGDADDWSGILRDNFTSVRAGTDNFRYYIAEGPIHGGTVFDVFYHRNTNGVPLSSWLGELVSGNLPDDVACEGDACMDDPVCAACSRNEIDDVGTCVWCLNW